MKFNLNLENGTYDDLSDIAQYDSCVFYNKNGDLSPTPITIASNTLDACASYCSRQNRYFFGLTSTYVIDLYFNFFSLNII